MSETSAGSIAIVGVAGKFPGARDVNQFWKNLVDGVESITQMTDCELLESGISAEDVKNPNYVKARAILGDADAFDAAFFGYSPREAELMDPQHRLFLESAWHALEDAGCDPARYAGAIGVFAGVSLNTYLLANLSGDGKFLDDLTESYQTGNYHMLVGNDKDFLPTRVSYKLNLRGPSMSIQTACSTSLVAVCQACQSLLNYQCDMALAGAVSVSFPQKRGHLYQEGALASADGHCRSFDANAKGAVFGDGVGIVALKRMEDAIADGDNIYAVIKGFAVNNDGSNKVGYTAPSVSGQAEVIAQAQALAGVEADSISYIEAHGTATPLGDPIEIAALTQAFRAGTDKKQFCAIGTAKTNVGHLDVASGVTGLIKAALALRHKQIPASLNFEKPNPLIDFANSPFYVNAQLAEWKAGVTPRRAGVSSFGVGGTNAHIVLEEAPVAEAVASERGPHLIILSAKTEVALKEMSQNLAAHLESNPDINLADVSFTLQMGRAIFDHRRVVFAMDARNAASALRSPDAARAFGRQVTRRSATPLTGRETPAELAQRWLTGEEVDWTSLHSAKNRRRVVLPVYPFARTRYLVPRSKVRTGEGVAIVSDGNRGAAESTAIESDAQVSGAVSTASRKETVTATLKLVLKDLSGRDFKDVDENASFFELGFDSLFLTQAALALRKKFSVKITFRQLLEDLFNIEALAAYIDQHLPLETKFRTEVPAPKSAEPKASVKVVAPAQKRFGPFKPIETGVRGALTSRQQKHLDDLVKRYTGRTSKSKQQTQDNRAHLADPRTVSSFNRLWKEMVYPIVVENSAGSKFRDVDGNEYVDMTMGFGTNLLGHTPQFITDAIAEQLRHGMEVGPQMPLAGKVAKLMCEFTGMERVAFCNTGSEAVMAAMRVARTVSGRTRIATTSGFHGINDEVLVRATVVDGQRRSWPVAPGIPEHIVKDVLVVDYGTPESLEILKAHVHELAAVLVEPVQSRRPDLQPRAFLKELRKITREAETALIFDEVITGFRCHPGGAQALFDVRADIATYGKIIGGGMPIGAVAGSAAYMDALDGGMWQYGDDSFPEVGVTFFAGTYIRHPLTMAASWAILDYLKQQGPALQRSLTERTAAMVRTLNDFLIERGVPLHIENFASVFHFQFDDAIKYGSLLYFYLREKGVHIWEGRPGFLSTAHSEADVEFVIHAFKESIIEMQRAGFLPESADNVAKEQENESPLAISAPEVEQAAVVVAAEPHSQITWQPSKRQQMQFSLYCFGNYPAAYAPEKYKLIFEGAKFADTHGFSAVLLPERHFHSIGGFSPNPSVLAAALARITERVQLRGASVVLPLHHPVRVAEEWSVVDNISNGRVGICIGSGWHPNDFIFAPTAFEKRRELCGENLEIIRKLWRGETVDMPAGAGSEFGVKLHPLPKQEKLPVWFTCIQAESYAKAGEMGVGVLGYLMNQSVADLEGKIRLYREALAKHGHDPASGNVTILLHTFVSSDQDKARSLARGPLREYLRSFLDNSQKRHETERGAVEIDQEDIEFLLDRAFEDYVNGKALIGTPESCAEIVDHLHGIGVDEIGCFIDFGVDQETVLASLPQLYELKKKYGSEELTFPLTESQQGLWMLTEMNAGAARAYNETLTLELRGELDIPALERSLRVLADRHEALRTGIDASGETQTMQPEAIIDFTVEDCSGSPEKAAQRLKETESLPFDLQNGPFFRTLVLKTADQHHLLLIGFNHVICNGPSHWIFMEELAAVYAAECKGVKPQLERVLQPRDYVKWRQGLDLREAETYWTDLFKDLPPALELPLDHPRPQTVTYNGARQRITLDADLCSRLRKAGAEQRCSLFMTLLAGFNILLHRLTGQDDVVVGVPFDSSVRDMDGGKNLFTNTTNVVPLRSRINDATRVGDYLAGTKKQVLEATDCQEYFLGRLIKAINLPRDPARSLLFSALFNFESGEFHKKLDGLEIELLTNDSPNRGPAGTTLYELYVNVAEKNGVLELQCDHNVDLFDPETVKRWLGYYKSLLEGMASKPDQTLHALPMLGEEERHHVLVEWNDTMVDYPKDALLHQLIESQVELTPDAVAVTFEDSQLSYRELNNRSNKLAHELQRRGAGPETLVAICAERSLEMVIGLLAVLKAGGAYVPLDPDYPQERLAFMLSDAKSPVLLTQSHLTSRLPEHSADVILMDQFEGESGKNPESDVNAENLAYVIYTSGSTGKPKGAMNTHRGICNRLLWMQDAYKLTNEDRILQKTPFTFDVSVWEFFWPLMFGARLVVARPGLHGDSSYLINAICEQKITTLHFVPPMLSAFLTDKGAGKCGSLKRVICSGEALAHETQQRFFSVLPGAELHNLYGPTEAAVDVTFWKCESDSSSSVVPIGRPVANTQIYLLNQALQPVPPGVAGELHIGGVQLARGYLARPELTSEKFIPNPFGEGKLYKTGDLAKYRKDGVIEFLGRLDHQVKIRGLRIELEEIEAVLAQQSSVQQCVVLGREDRPGEKRLVAYCVPRKTNVHELWPSSPSTETGPLYDDLQYRMMSNDKPRNACFKAALERLAKGKVVMDAGTGKDAILARLSLEAGARKVYAAEYLEKPAQQAQSLVKSLQLEDKLQVIQGDIRDIELPEQVDVIVSENLGHIGGAEGWDLILNNARKFLKPGAVFVPSRCQTHMAAVSLPDAFLKQPAFSELAAYYAEQMWEASGYKYDLRLSITGTGREHLRSTTGVFEYLDFSKQATAGYEREICLKITRNSRIDGFLLWLNIETAPGIVFDGLKNQDSWLPVYLPVFYPGIDVHEGDEIRGIVKGMLSENGTNRDYSVSGRVVRKHGVEVSFDYKSNHYKQIFKHNAFYEKLFRNDAINASVSSKPAPGALIPELTSALRAKLPDYMVPSAFVVLDAMPLTSNGKIDRRALPAPALLNAGESQESPKTTLEEKLRDIWKQVLGIPDVGIHTNFFEAGGDSLSALRIVNQIRDFLNEHVSLVVIFEAPTIAALAALLEKNYADEIALLEGEAKSVNDSVARINTSKIEVMRNLIGTVPPALPLNGAGKNPRAIFILSPMRSGSTLLRVMLAGNPRLFSPPELLLFMFNTLAERSATWSQGYDRYNVEGTIRAIMEIKDCDMAQAQTIMQGFERDGWSVQKFFRQMQDWVSPRIVVDKSPEYAMDIEILKRIELYFENPFYIHLARHPLGMIHSYEKGRFILESLYRGRHNFSAKEMAELTWLVSHQNTLQFLSGIPAGRQHRVKFEDMVGSPEPTMRGLCRALGVEFDPGMVQPYEDSNKKMTDGVHPLSQQVGDHNFQRHQKIKAEVAESWREKYTEDFLGEETWRVAEILGYQNPFENPVKNQQSIALNPIAMVSREARRVKRTTV
ncbi:MAG: amino acid adenylation domain-containing protein [Chthoniobacteraceae bacterium]